MIAPLRLALARRMDGVRSKASRWDSGVKALLWMAASGFLYCLLNAALKGMSLRMSPYQALAMVYGATLLVMLPTVLRSGAAHSAAAQPVRPGRARRSALAGHVPVDGGRQPHHPRRNDRPSTSPRRSSSRWVPRCC
jgi:hypothetical protein